MSDQEDQFIQEVREIFAIEAREHLDIIEDILLQLEKNPDLTDRLDQLFRVMHTLKGGAAAAAHVDIAKIGHEFETTLQYLRDGQIRLTKELINLFFLSIDKICKMLYEQIYDGPQDLSKLIAQFQEFYPKTEASGITRSDSQQPRQKKPRSKKTLSDQSKTATKSKTLPRKKTKKVVNSTKENEDLQKDDDHSDQFIFSGYELGSDLDDLNFYHLTISKDVFKDTFAKNINIVKNIYNFTIVIQCKTEDIIYEDLAEIAVFPETPLNVLSATKLNVTELSESISLSERFIQKADHQLVLSHSDSGMIFFDQLPENDQDLNPKESSDFLSDDISNTQEVLQKDSVPVLMRASPTIRIKVDILDQLMRLASELVLVRNQQLKIVNQENDEARASTQRLDAITTEIQSQIMATRMQPIGNIFSKFNRIVRDLAQKLDKSIELTTTGDDVELDKTILESLADPLMHIIRNCCDHGIEDSRTRIKNKKAVKGTISLRAFHEGGLVNIEIKDDGGGISLAGIRKKALNKNLKSADELSKMTDRELLQLIFLPGFSTAAKITDVSGRGVGMDVVKVSIEKLGGNIEVKSFYKQGTEIFLRLPLTLAIIPCLIIECEQQIFAIPQVNLEELIALSETDAEKKLEMAGNMEVFRSRNTLLPIVRLSQILKKNHHLSKDFALYSSEEKKSRTDQILYFAVLKSGDKRFGLVVDHIIGTEEVVISPMHSALKDIHIYSGATVRGDGQVSLILDAFGISEFAGVSGAEGTSTINHELPAVQTDLIWSSQDEQPMLLFSLNHTEQIAVVQKEIKRVIKVPMDRIQSVGKHVITSIDDTFTYVLFLDQYLPISERKQSKEIYLIIPKAGKIPIAIYAIEISDIEKLSGSDVSNLYKSKGIEGSSMVNNKITFHVNINTFVEECEKEVFRSDSNLFSA